ncbi:MAG: glucosidase, partial [Planctomycetota bacterium]|nr:glucosidase [Planctomycetota bacterium]
EFPTGSGRRLTLAEVALELRGRLINLFLPDASGRRPCHGADERFAKDPAWRDLVLFYEHFHPESGRGVGASHQTGWTALVATMALVQAGRSMLHQTSGMDTLLA